MIFEYRPIPVFVSFHQSMARDRLIVGGYGSGKSHAGVGEIQAWGLEQPGSEFLVTRKTVPALRDTTEKIFLEQLPSDFLAACEVARAGGHIEHITFPTGSTYYFRGMDDWKKLRSMNLTGILWDEADEFTREDYEGMNSRIRQTRPTKQARELGYAAITRRGHILAANPQGHNWLYADFVDPKTAKPNSAFWTSTSLDNPYLPLDYVQSLLAMPDPWVRRYVLCSFDEFAGSIYPTWSWDTHVVSPYRNGIGKFEYPAGGFFRMGFDPGTAAGNAGVWCYYDQAKACFVGVAEYNETGLNVAQHTKEWRRIEALHGMRVQSRIADPKAVATRDRGSNVRLADIYRRAGFYFRLGPNSIDDRVTALGQLIHAGRFKVTSDCPRLYEQILNYRWEDLTPLQIEKGRTAKPLKKDVDLVDAAQYVVSSYVAPPKIELPKTDEEQFTREMHAAIKKQLSNRIATRNHDLGSIPV